MAPKSYLLAAGLLSAATGVTAAPYAPIRPRQTEDIFAHVTPSSKLQWYDCYEESWQCAYLTVPLDYNNTKAGTTDVAFIKYVVDKATEDIVFNPGGPGVSGVELIQGYAPIWAKYWPGYNFVSFDPRGVGHTLPKLTCGFLNDAKRRRDLPVEELKTAWDENLKDHQACSAANANTNIKYVGTLAVVQDIMHFTEQQAIARGKDPKKALVNYYGISYGTLIGQTLVATYPDRLRRVLLDGNIYGVAHYAGWEPSGTYDFAHAVLLFTQLCFEAGEELCGFAADAKSASEVKERFDSVVDALENEPATFDNEQWTQADFLSKIESLLYTPSTQYGDLSNFTTAFYNNEQVDVAKMMRKREEPEQQDASAVQIITSVDIAGRFPFKKFEEFQAAAKKLYDETEYHGVFYSKTNGLNGLGASIIPPPSQLFPGFKPVKPSTKVLFINTNGDPVTPVYSIRQMSPFFAGSGSVIVEGPGHGFESAPSKCAQNFVVKYWADGSVPNGEARCKSDVEADYYFGGDVPEWVWQ